MKTLALELTDNREIDGKVCLQISTVVKENGVTVFSDILDTKKIDKEIYEIDPAAALSSVISWMQQTYASLLTKMNSQLS